MNARLLLCFCLLLLLAACQGADTRSGARGYTAEPARNLMVETARPPTLGATRKLALVIGNDNYPEAPLRNPLNDARDMAAMLARLGFEVIHEDNRNKQQMEELVRRFGDRLRPGMVGLFYFAGHGMQLKDHNYLIPVQSGIQREDEVPYHAFDVGQLLSKMESAGNNSNLVFLDACRDNPFARSFRSATFTGGFSFGDAPSGTLIAYAAKSGMKSKDGDRQNGLYTEALLKRLATPGLKITDLLIEVRNEVKWATNGSQIPWEEVGLESNFCFAGCGGQPPSPAPAPESRPAPRPVSPDAAEQEYWDNVRASSDPADYQAYLEQYPDGRHVALAKNAIQRLRQRPALIEGPPKGQTIFSTVTPLPVPIIPLPQASSNVQTPEMVRLSGGTFWMGSPETEIDRWYNESRHRVTVRSFAIGKYEVTQAEWRSVMGTNPSAHSGCDSCPVENVSGYDIQDYLARLNSQTGGKFRLPTEAEWEYACRADGSNRFCGSDDIDAVGWYNTKGPVSSLPDSSGHSFFNPFNLIPDPTQRVGRKRPNAWGLYDMSGNVQEWTCSAYTEKYDGSESVCTDVASRWVLRGGSLDFGPSIARAAARSGGSPGNDIFGAYRGFRLAQD